MRSSSTPLQVIASPCVWYGCQGDHPANACTLTISRHSCSSYRLPLASIPVRMRKGVRSIRVFTFMGNLSGCELRNSQFRPGKVPTLSSFTHHQQPSRAGLSCLGLLTPAVDARFDSGAQHFARLGGGWLFICKRQAHG